MAIVVGVFETVPKDLKKSLEELEISEIIETMLSRILLRSGRILRRVQETWGELQSLRIHGKFTCCEQLVVSKMIIVITILGV